MSNIKPNIKKQASVIKHYNGHSLIRSIRSHNSVTKLYPSYKCSKSQSFPLFLTILNSYLFFSICHKITEHFSSPMLPILQYYVSSTPNSFCHKSALHFHLICWWALKIDLSDPTNYFQTSLSSVYLVPMSRSQAQTSPFPALQCLLLPLSVSSLITCSWSSPELVFPHSHFFFPTFSFSSLVLLHPY